MKSKPRTLFKPNSYYLIQNSGNNDETLFYEERNYAYFVRLLKKHLQTIGSLEAFRLEGNRFDLLIRTNPEDAILEKYRCRVHQPLANFFIAYTKTINKYYGRSGSLFRESLKRKQIDEVLFETLKKRMEDGLSGFPDTPMPSPDRVK